jgi:hypothetical protein
MTVKKFEMTVPLRLGERSPCVPPLPGPARFAGIVEIQPCATKGNDSGGVAGTALTVKWEHIDLTAVCSVGITSPDAF